MSTSEREDVTLRLENVQANIAAQTVLRGITLDIPDGEFLAVLGHNGAGKTSLLRAIMRLLPLTGGDITLGGKSITRLNTAGVVRSGISLVPQERGTFENLSVEDNLKFVLTDGAIQLPAIFELFPILKERREQMVGTLSGGQRQMVAISMALLANPRVLLLDEPSVGLQPNLVDTMMEVAKQANKEYGMTVILVEQNIEKVLQVADRVVVINQGKIVLDDQTANVDANQIWQLL